MKHKLLKRAVSLFFLLPAAGSPATAHGRGGGAGGSIRFESQYCHGNGRIAVQGKMHSTSYKAYLLIRIKN